MQKAFIGAVDKLTAPSQGAFPQPDGMTQWCIWAPQHERVTLLLGEGARSKPMPCVATTMAISTGEGPPRTASVTRIYWVTIGASIPIPFSRWQPDGVNHSSAVFDPARFGWSDAGCAGIAADALVIYELHVGTFTRQGTFAAVIDRLDELRDLGVTALELMPMREDFPAAATGVMTVCILLLRKTPTEGPTPPHRTPCTSGAVCTYTTAP